MSSFDPSTVKLIDNLDNTRNLAHRVMDMQASSPSLRSHPELNNLLSSIAEWQWEDLKAALDPQPDPAVTRQELSAETMDADEVVVPPSEEETTIADEVTAQSDTSPED